MMKKHSLFATIFTLFTLVIWSNTNAFAQDKDYQPDKKRLDSKASRSTNLYVEPEFSFDTNKMITLDIQAIDDKGVPLGKHLVFISGREIHEDDSPDMLPNYSLLGIELTDEAGNIYKQMEISSEIDELEIKVQAVGIKDRINVNLSEVNHIQHIFN